MKNWKGYMSSFGWALIIVGIVHLMGFFLVLNHMHTQECFVLAIENIIKYGIFTGCGLIIVLLTRGTKNNKDERRKMD